MIEFNHVFKSIKNRLILDDISFIIRKKIPTAIVGKSGAGKTTIARMMNGLITKDHGNIRIDNIELNDYNIQKIRQKVGFVFQNFNLFHHMNAKENIIYTPLKVYKLDKDFVLQNLEKLSTRFQVIDHINKYPHELSNGQKQRIAIIRSLILNPDIIIMDEPTSALDPGSTNSVIKMLNDIKEEGITIVIISHDMNVVKEVSEDIIYIVNKKCQKIDDKKNFFQNTANLF